MSESRIAIVWRKAPLNAQLQIIHGHLRELSAPSARVDGGRVIIAESAPSRWLVTMGNANVDFGTDATRILVDAGEQSFSFFLRDVSSRTPIFWPLGQVAVTLADDPRDYEQIAAAVGGNRVLSKLDQTALEPEESFDHAAKHVASLHAQTWLGLSRDLRLFELDIFSERGYWGLISPRVPVTAISLPETDNKALVLAFMVGRGMNCVRDLTRQLEDGTLPILHSTQRDGAITYHLTAFADMESTPLTDRPIAGQHYLLADLHASNYSMDEQKLRQAKELQSQVDWDQIEQTLLCMRVVAHNSSSAPAYAWMQAPHPAVLNGLFPPEKDFYHDAPGLGGWSKDRVFCVARVNGKPMHQGELAMLIPPGESVTVEYYLPHRPINAARAGDLLNLKHGTFEERHERCRAYWKAELSRGAQITLPETRIQNMIVAGMAHLEILTLGQEPDGRLAPLVGVYGPIGTESSPIIQFYDFIGRHDLARRCLQYFIEKLRPSGQLQNYSDYGAETGPLLWTLGEHFRMTDDLSWVESIQEPINRACDFLIANRRRNMTPERRGNGYGLLDGSVADPKEPLHYYFNSGYACVGLTRASEMLAKIDPERSAVLAREAAELRQDILVSVRESLARGPVVPLGDGSWVPTVGPFPETDGLLSLLANRTSACTHGHVGIHDAALGPLYLILQEVLEPTHPYADMILRANDALYTLRSVAPSQPYYCRHDIAHLRRGEVKAFLKCYYNTFASQADRETYTFWEHQGRLGCVHKTHEEAWFLMQTRWMLVLENGPALHLLPGIPRAWMSGTRPLHLKNVASYFGPLDLLVQPHPDAGRIEACLKGASRRLPERVTIRLPHSDGIRAKCCNGGIYDPGTECVTIMNYQGRAQIILTY